MLTGNLKGYFKKENVKDTYQGWSLKHGTLNACSKGTSHGNLKRNFEQGNENESKHGIENMDLTFGPFLGPPRAVNK